MPGHAVLQHVIFDLDGTLVDSVPGIQWSAEAAMRECGFSRACCDLTPLIGPPIRAILAVAAGTNDTVELNGLEKAFRIFYDTGGWKRTLCQPGVRTMLERLMEGGASVSIVTNKPAYSTRLILRELSLDGYFRETVCRDSAPPHFGSKAEMLTDLVKRGAMPRAQAIMVGDTMEDCEAAAAAGIACALVAHGYGKGTDGILPAGCARIAGWDELVEWCLGGVGGARWPRRLSSRSAAFRGLL
jgi:phosphoglycolate phosphatase